MKVIRFLSVTAALLFLLLGTLRNRMTLWLLSNQRHVARCPTLALDRVSCQIAPSMYSQSGHVTVLRQNVDVAGHRPVTLLDSFRMKSETEQAHPLLFNGRGIGFS